MHVKKLLDSHLNDENDMFSYLSKSKKLIFFKSKINLKETHTFTEIIEVILTLMTSRYVIKPSKIVKINFFILILYLDIQYYVKYL